MTDSSSDNTSTHYIQLMQSRARSLFLHHPHAIFELDPFGRFRHANPAAGRFANINENEGQGLHFTRFLEADDSALVERHFQQAVDGRPSRCEATINTPDGERLRARLSLLPVAYDNHVTGVYVILEQPEVPSAPLVSAATRRLLEAMPIGVALLDLTQRDFPIRLCNSALCQLLERSRDALEGHPLPLLQKQKDPAVQRLQAALASRQAASERLQMTPGDKSLDIRLQLQPMANESEANESEANESETSGNGASEASAQMLAVHIPLEAPFPREEP